MGLLEYKITIYKAALLSYMCYRAKSHGTLTNLGILAALFTGLVHSYPKSPLYLNLIVLFFLLGNISTKYRKAFKEKLTKVLEQEETVTNAAMEKKSHSKRTHIQVFSNSLPATLLVILSSLIDKNESLESKKLLVGVVVNYAVSTSDTWSSEFGILSHRKPILITTLKPCSKGTNGGVSFEGLVAAFFGSLIISIAATFSDDILSVFLHNKLYLISYITAFGVIGTLVDSFIGAVFQSSLVDLEDGIIVENYNGSRVEEKIIAANLKHLKSTGWDILDNNGVNLTTLIITVGLSILFL